MSHAYSLGKFAALCKVGIDASPIAKGALRGAAIGSGVGALSGSLLSESVRDGDSRLEAALKGGLIGGVSGAGMGAAKRTIDVATAPKGLPASVKSLDKLIGPSSDDLLEMHLRDRGNPTVEPAMMGFLSGFAGQSPMLKRDQKD